MEKTSALFQVFVVTVESRVTLDCVMMMKTSVDVMMEWSSMKEDETQISW